MNPLHIFAQYAWSCKSVICKTCIQIYFWFSTLYCRSRCGDGRLIPKLVTTCNYIQRKNSLLCTQEFAFGFYPERDESSQHSYRSFFKIHLIPSSHLCLGAESVLFPSGFPTTILYAFIISNNNTACLFHLIFLICIIFATHFYL